MDYPGEKLLLKLWETLAEKGVGSLLKPWHEKRVSRARNEIRREEILILAQAEKEAEAIKAGQSICPTGDLKLLCESSNNTCNQRFTFQPKSSEYFPAFSSP